MTSRITPPDLELLATADAARLASVLHEVLREVEFDQVNRDLRLPEYGGDYLIRPFPLPGSAVDVADMKVRLRHVVKSAENESDRRFARRIHLAFRFLMFGESLERKDVAELVGAGREVWIEQATVLGLFVADGPNRLRMNGLSVCSRRLPGGDGLYLLADTPPHFATRSGPLRVYAGADSYELMLRISTGEPVSGYVAEMGSGSGVQLIAALRKHRAIVKAIGVECDRRAMHVSVFNAALNEVADRFAVVSDAEPLREALGNQRVAFGMSNPPFLAVPATVRIEGGSVDVKTVFPQAGWGGEDGLDVTRHFVEVLRSVEGAGSKNVIYSQFAGDEHGPSRIRSYIEGTGDFEFAFEPLKSDGRIQKKSIHTAGESALIVARLLTAALLEKQEPTRVIIAVRKGGPEHALMENLAAQIEASYRRLGISHFHDGFVHLVRRS